MQREGATRPERHTQLKDRHELLVVDLYEHPEAAAREDRRIADPSKAATRPGDRIIGDLSDRQRVLPILGISVPTPGAS